MPYLILVQAPLNALAAVEAPDHAAFTATLSTQGILATTEAPDRAAFTAVLAPAVGTLVATERQDRAGFSGSTYTTGNQPASLAQPPAIPAVPADLSGGPRGGAVVRWANSINKALRGNISATVKVTLVPNATQSIINDSRIGVWTHVGLTPLSADAAAILPSIWIEVSDCQATLHHSTTAHTDCNFIACFIGA